MLAAMLLSIIFIVLDILSVTSVLSHALPVGINPFWKLSFVFKCLTDSVVLDDFKTALDRLRAFKISRLGSFAADPDDSRSRDHMSHVKNFNNWGEPPKTGEGIPIADLPPMPSPDGDYVHSSWQEHKEMEETDAVGGVARSASRDRDLEENAIDALDHAGETQRETSRSHILNNSESWPPQRSMEDSSDLDLDYAMAVREMTNDAKAKNNIHIGTAK